MDLRRAKLERTRLRYAALVGARLDAGAFERADTFAMAPAEPARPGATTAAGASEALCVCVSPDGVLVASGHGDGSIRLWDTSTGLQKRVLESHTSFVRSVAFAPDGFTLASASDDSTVRLWDTSSGEQKRVLQGHKHAVRSVAFAPDGLTLASASHDKTVRLWDTSSGEQKRLLQGHKNAVFSVAFAPDGRTLASASADGTIRLWSTATGAHLATLLPCPEGWAALLPDGRYKLGGDIAGAFWHVIGLVRFEPGELDPYLPEPLRIPDDEPLLGPR